MNKIQYIILHHTGGTDTFPLADSSHFTFIQCNDLHRKSFNFISSLGFYIGYHYYIDKKGIVTQGRLDTDEGAHCIGYNNKSIGICMAGNFDLTLPTKEQEQSLGKLLNELMNKYKLPFMSIVPHRRFAKKTCYGKNIHDYWGIIVYLKYKLLLLLKLSTGQK